MRHGWLRLVVMGLLATGVVGVPGARARGVKATLTPTVAAPGGSGRAVVSARNARGKFTVLAKHLAPFTTFQVVVGGTPIGTLVTGASGTGRARFSTSPSGNDQHLGIDPRGEHVTVHETDDGEDALEGDVPDDDPTAVSCCLPDDDGSECEDRTPDECTHEGGMPGSGSCLPDPCGGTTDGELVACCEPDDQELDAQGDDGGDGEPECELRTAAHCAEHHGAVMMASASCAPNPCMPAGGDAIRCCLAEEHDATSMRDDDGTGEGSELECEHLTAQHCADAGGSNIGPGSCEGDPCAAPGGTPAGGSTTGS